MGMASRKVDFYEHFHPLELFYKVTFTNSMGCIHMQIQIDKHTETHKHTHTDRAGTVSSTISQY